LLAAPTTVVKSGAEAGKALLELAQGKKELTAEEKAQLSDEMQSRVSSELYRKNPFEALDFLRSEETQEALRAAYVPSEVIDEALGIVRAAVGRETVRIDAENGVAAELAFMTPSEAQAHLNSRVVQTRLLDAGVSPRVIKECREVVAEAARAAARRRQEIAAQKAAQKAAAQKMAAQKAAAERAAAEETALPSQEELLREWRESSAIASWYDAGVRLVPSGGSDDEPSEQELLLGGVAVALALGAAAFLQQTGGAAPPTAGL